MNKGLILTVILLLSLTAYGIFGVDFYLQDGTGIRMTKEQSCSSTLNEYTCEYDFVYNATGFRCRQWNSFNSTWDTIYEHTYDYGFPPNATGYWYDNEVCINTNRANVWFNQSNDITHYICDYSTWGECSLDLPNKGLMCDSKYDGNNDGICQDGESCLIMDMSDGVGSLREFKQTYRELNTDEFGVTCQRQ